MTKLRSLLLVAGMAVLATTGHAQQTWTVQRIPTGTFNPNVDRTSPTVVIDTLQNFHVAYTQETFWTVSYGGTTSSVRYIWLSPSTGTWSTPLVVELGTIHHSTALALDSTNGLHFLYSKNQNMYHRLYSGGAFNTAVNLGNGNNPIVTQGHYQAGAISPNGTLGMMWGDKFRTRDKLGVWSGTSTIPGGTTSRGASIARARDNRNHVVFADFGPPYSIYYSVAGTGNAFAGTTTLASGIPSVAGGIGSHLFGLAVATDLDNFAHVIFTKVISTTPLKSAVFYTHNLEGTWSTPTPISDTALFNRLGFVIDDNNALHVAVERRALSGGDWDIYYFTSYDGTWSTPEDISENNSDDVLFSGGARSIAVRDSLVALAYMTKDPTMGDGVKWEIALARSTFYPPSRLFVDPDTLDFGNILTGVCKDTTFMLRSINRIRTQTITASLQKRSGADSARFTQTNPTGSVQLLTNDSSQGTIRFCAQDSSGCYTAKFLYRASNGTRDSLVVKACAVGPKLNVKPDTVDFGAVLTGDCKDTTVMVYNVGGDFLRMAHPVAQSPAGNVFRPDSITGNMNISHLDSAEAHIWFCPTVGGVVTGKIIYSGTRSAYGSDTIYVRGNAIGPRLRVDPDTLDFGAVGLGTCKDSTISIINQGGTLLRVGPAAVTGTAARQFRISNPNDSIRLVKLASRNKSISFCPLDTGCFTAQITVNSNGGNKVVVVKGCAIPPIVQMEPDTIDFGVVLINECKDTSVTVRNTGLGWLVSDKPTIPLGGVFQVRSPLDSFRVAPGSSDSIQIAFCAYDTGCVESRLRIETPVGRREVVLIGCGGSALIETSLMEIDFGGVPIGGCRDTSYMVYNRGNLLLDITGQSLNSTKFSIVSPTPATFKLPAGDSQRVTIRFCPTDPAQIIEEIWIASNTTGTSPRIKLKGRGLSGDLDFPSRIDFGDVPLTNCRDTLLAVRNKGNASVSLTQARLMQSFGDRGFTLVAPTPPRTVAAGDTIHLRLRFCPKDVNVARDTGAFTTGATVRKTSLLGRGISGSLATSPLLLDFGDVESGSCKRDTVTITNIGTPPVELTSEKIEGMLGGPLSGAFKYISPSPLPTTIAPGKSIKVVLEYCPAAVGPDSAVWKGSGTAGSQVAVDLRGSGVRRGVTVTSEILFSCTLVGEVSFSAVTVLNTGTTPITLVGYSISPTGEFTAPSVQNAQIGPGESRTDSVQFSPTTAPGTPSAELTVTTSISETKVTVRGEAGVVPSIKAELATLEFGNISVGDTGTQCLIISNPSCRSLEINGVSIGNSEFRLALPRATPFTLAGYGSDTLCIEFLPGTQGDAAGSITFADRNGGTTAVALHGTGVQPSVTARPKSVDFGSVNVGATSLEEMVAVVNLGTLSATIHSTWQLSGTNPADFTVTPPTLPADLPGGGLDTLWFKVTFSPQASGDRSADLTIANSSPTQPVIQLSGRGDVSSISASPLVIDMGGVTVGKSRTAADTLVLTNNGTLPVDLANLTMKGGDSAYFTLIGFAPGTIGIGESRRYGVRFSPDAARDFATAAVATLSNGSESRVEIRGHGINRLIAAHVVVIDTISTHVGNRSRMTMRLLPALSDEEGVIGYTVKLRVDPNAIYPHGLVGAGANKPGEATTMKFAPDGAITVTHPGIADEPLTGSELFTLEFEGLVTGKPENVIAIEEITFKETTGDLALSNGIVFLSGCDIGRGVSFGKGVILRSITPNPVGSDAIITYEAPDGSSPRLRLLDMSGQVIRTDQLPVASGKLQEVRLDVEAIASGMYVLEIGQGENRVAVSIVINK